MEMTLRGEISRTLPTDSPVPRSLETRTKRGFPHSHSDDYSDGQFDEGPKAATNHTFYRFLHRTVF